MALLFQTASVLVTHVNTANAINHDPLRRNESMQQCDAGWLASEFVAISLITKEAERVRTWMTFLSQRNRCSNPESGNCGIDIDTTTMSICETKRVLGNWPHRVHNRMNHENIQPSNRSAVEESAGNPSSEVITDEKSESNPFFGSPTVEGLPPTRPPSESASSGS
jgi:hypothetical protein